MQAVSVQYNNGALVEDRKGSPSVIKAVLLLATLALAGVVALSSHSASPSPTPATTATSVASTDVNARATELTFADSQSPSTRLGLVKAIKKDSNKSAKAIKKESKKAGKAIVKVSKATYKDLKKAANYLGLTGEDICEMAVGMALGSMASAKKIPGTDGGSVNTFCAEMCVQSTVATDAAGGGVEDPVADAVAGVMAYGCKKVCGMCFTTLISPATSAAAKWMCPKILEIKIPIGRRRRRRRRKRL